MWEGFLDRLGGGKRSFFARIDVGYSAGDLIEFVGANRREVRRITRKEPCLPEGWCLLTVET